MSLSRNVALTSSLALSIFLAPCVSASFGIFKGREKLPSETQIAAHEDQAARLYAKAKDLDERGKAGKANDYFKKIVKKYPHTRTASEAQFQVAEYLRNDGKVNKAFLAYQEFIENYRYNPRFQKALDHQFNIAVKGMNEKTAKFLGINRPLDRSELITMMEQIISNAPQSAYAPYCQYYIGELYDVLGKRPMAVAAYQKVVNEYPRSKLAPKAQLQIGETLGAAVAKGSNDPANLKRTKEAYEDFLTNFPQHADSSLAQQNLTQLNEKDARKSMNVGKFYQKSGNLRAAAIYFKDVLRSTNPALKKEARDQLARIGKKDPEALKQAKISPEATTTPPEERIKSHARYVGPPAPDVASRSTKKSRPTKSVDPAPSTTAKKSTPKPAPAPSTPLVPDLPGSDLLTSDPSLSSDDPFNVDKVVPDSPLDPDSL